VKRAMGVLMLGVLFAVPTPAKAGNLHLRLGAFFPSADSNLFDDDSVLYSRGEGFDANGFPRGIEDSDWIGFTGGVEYSFKLVPNVELGLHVDGYGKKVDTFYREFTRADGSDIFQTLELDIVPLGFTVRLVPTTRRDRLAPYIGVGADLVFWRYKEYGDFVDFQSPNPLSPDIIADSFRSDSVTGGLHVAGGLRVPIGHDFAVVTEGRYQWAKDDMGDDFRPQEPGLVNKIDLGGWSATIGFLIHF
jgi:hypothetical protein